MKKRFMSALTLTAMLLTFLVCCTAFAAGSAMQSGTDALSADPNTDAAQILHYGGRTWYVIGYDGSGNVAAKNGAVTLFQKLVYECSRYDDTRQSCAYHGSILEGSVNKLLFGGENAIFTQKEQDALTARALTGGNAYYNQAGYDKNTVAGEGVSAILWPLSDGEATSLPESIRKAKSYKNTIGSWWLRSPGDVEARATIVWRDGEISHTTNVGNGGTIPDVGDFSAGIRPAFDLDMSAVLFTSAATGGKASGAVGKDALTAVGTNATNGWKVTLKDSARSFAVADSSVSGNIVTATYTGAAVGTNEFISAVVTDSAGNVKYYGRVAAPGSTSGTAEITLPSGMADTDTLALFSEQMNGDGKTDLASALVPISLTYQITNTLTNITTDNTASERAISDTADYTATLTAEKGFVLPDTVTVKVGGSELSASDYTYSKADGSLTVPAGKISGNIEIIAAAETEPVPVPVTGDSGAPVLWMTILLLSCAVLLTAKKRRAA